MAGSQKGSHSEYGGSHDASHKPASRAGRGLDLWDASKNRYIGAVSLGFSPAGTRIRKKVTGRTKTEVRDKLRELHKQVEGGLRPRRRYTVEDALEDWLAHGLDGVSARTVTLYRGTIAKALSEELGGVRLTDLTEADVQKALTAMASRVSTRTVQIAHNVLVRAIRQAERDDLVGRNVATLVKPPKGQAAGRPSKSLTLEQAVALMAAAHGTRLEAYITLSLLTGLRTEEVRALRWDHVVAWVGGQWSRRARPGSITSSWQCSCGGPTGPGAIRRHRSLAGRWRCRGGARRRYGSSECGRRRTGWRPGRRGTITTWCSRRP